MNRWFMVVSYVIGGLGVWAILANASPWVAIGVVLLIWSHEVYKLAENGNEVRK